ncbi:MAG: hypothetical protein ABEH78_09390 [Haloferacaceae archaeon]
MSDESQDTVRTYVSYLLAVVFVVLVVGMAVVTVLMISNGV